MGSFLFNPPLGARINWSHPINRGLVGCWLMNEGGGQVYRNLAGNRGATDGVGIGNPVPVMSPYGRAMFFDGATQYVDMGSSIPFDSDNWSMALWFWMGQPSRRRVRQRVRRSCPLTICASKDYRRARC